MNVADLMELLKQHDPLMRVLVADTNSIFGAHPDDVHVVEYSHAQALLIAPRELVENWDAVEP